MKDVKYVWDDNTEASEGYKAIKIPTKYDFDAGKYDTDGEVDDDNTFQGVVSRNTPIPNEQETNENDEGPNLRRSARNRKPPSPYQPDN